MKGAMASHFSLLVADPPWHYNNRVDHKGTPQARTRFGGGAQAHYALMTDKNIADMGPLVQAVAAPDAILAMWATMPKLDVALRVMEAWGFRYSTTGFVWIKTTAAGAPCRSPGYYTASNAEVVLFGRKGKTPRAVKPAVAMISSVILAPRMKHSAKPDAMQDRLDVMFPSGRRLELFGRRLRAGWHVIGNEITGKDIREDLERLARASEMREDGTRK